MKRMANPPNMSAKRVCFNKDAKLDSSFSDSAIPPHHFHLGQDIYAAVTYFAFSMQVHLRQYGRDENNRLYPAKKGVCMSPVLWQSLANRIELINVPSSSTEETYVLKDDLMISTVFIEDVSHITCQRYFKQKDFAIKFIPGTCVMNENYWLELAQIRKRITESAMSMVSDRIFRKLLLKEVSKITPNVVVDADISEVESILTTSLIELFCEYLGSSITDVFECFGCTQEYENQLGHECITMDHETRLQLYGDLALFAMNFEQLIQDFIQRNIQMLNYLNTMFVNKWDMLSIFDNAKSMYIAPDPNRLY
ncbi:PC4 domain-containing protein [Trichonephila clavata]|uniref:PC4 domain-containing protein n=1 Tax=Trichonephila clavata TaxID=2740835 RepID=A0A8X6FKU5_TRICU|nr:PC4 domain-containing protein [Trichonephila clavata]